MRTVSISIKDYERYVSMERGILASLRLDPDDWAVCGLETDMGDVPFFTDQPTIITDTSTISGLSLGSVTIDISYRHGKRHVCPSCGRAMDVNKWVSNTFSNPPMFGMTTSVRIRVPQLHCGSCPGYPQIRCPLAVRNHTFTKLCKFDMLRNL